VLFVFLAVFTRPTWSEESRGPFFIEWMGYLFLLAGLGVRVWSTFYIGGRKSHELVTDGPYSICRNPLYWGSLLVAVGVGLCFENALMLIALIAIGVPVHVLITHLEEKHLAERFPVEFAEYRRKVPRFWPRLGAYRSSETVVVSVRSIRRALFDTVAVLMIPEIEDLLEILHQQEIVPVLLYFPGLLV
jgi:protein-S-isoprenylcysteine O-methyltransferase Ste14